MEKKFISERQAALLLGVHPQTIKNWRDKGLLSLFLKIKKYPTLERVEYDKEALLMWVKSFKN